MRKALEIISWLGVVAYLILVLGFVSKEKKSIPCSNVNINITDETNNYFVEEQDVLSILKNKGENILGYPVDSINIARLETLIYKHPSIRNAEIYATMYGDLNIDIQQRDPILRVINYNNESYYIDNEGALMPLSSKYTAHVLVANGNINEPYALRYTKDIMNSEDKDDLNRSQILKDLYILARFIHDDPFWRSQIEQIYVKNNEFEMIPRVGTHTIIFGDLEDYKEKFRNLKAVYEVGFKKFGWNRYSDINLKYKNQVICTKR